MTAIKADGDTITMYGSEPNYDELLTGLFEFTDLGRDKVHRKVNLTGEKSLWRLVKQHLMSKDIEYEYDPDKNEGKIFVGVLRHVGSFRKI